MTCPSFFFRQPRSYVPRADLLSNSTGKLSKRCEVRRNGGKTSNMWPNLELYCHVIKSQQSYHGTLAFSSNSQSLTSSLVCSSRHLIHTRPSKSTNSLSSRIAIPLESMLLKPFSRPNLRGDHDRSLYELSLHTSSRFPCTPFRRPAVSSSILLPLYPVWAQKRVKGSKDSSINAIPRGNRRSH